ALDGEVVGAIELQPTIRPEALEIICDLHKRNIETVIISGDNDAPTRRLAADLGIDRYFAEVLPEDKANLVRQLQEEGHKVCFVGDGINDSIALKSADVAVSLRGATTIATDMAEIIFMNGTLGQLPELFTLADEFAANMRVNLVASMTPGIVGIAGTLLFGWGMTVCVFLMQSSTPVGIYNAVKPLLNEQRREIAHGPADHRCRGWSYNSLLCQ
ncbi:MAG: HAD-IC family P-type ATPase, partial [Caldilineaceae bacterium]|nr:HAD-IC family P-type ATPase [Caldilineaceae bacterium]